MQGEAVQILLRRPGLPAVGVSQSPGSADLLTLSLCRFEYGGCAGNRNNFFTLAECRRQCGLQETETFIDQM